MLRRHPASCATRVSRILYPVLALFLLGGATLQAQVIQTYSFEGGSADGWGSFNGASTPVSTTAAAFAGTSSLLTTTNSSGASSGPSISLTSLLQPGAQYTITGMVQLTPGETATSANFTMLRTGGAGCTCFDTIGPFKMAVTSNGWAQIGGTYTVPTTETGLLLYAQLVGPTTTQSFYLDDVVITETAPPPGGTTIATYTWSDGGLDGWFPFGSPTLTNATGQPADPIGNTHALLTTNRTATFMGPALNLLSVPNVVAGATYQVSAYVLLAAPYTDSPTVTMSTKLADCATSGAFNNLATTGTLSSTAWTLVTGVFSFSNQPGPPSSLDLYFQSNSATDSYYISNVRIGEIAPPPPDPSQQDNSGISTNFEDGGADGWTGHDGATVAPVSGVAHTGNNSLLVANRSANYQGAQISVSNKMYQGSVYNISVWVMMAPQDSSSHVINMSLQVTLNGNTSFPGVNGFPGQSVPDDGQWHQINVMDYNMASAYDQGQAFLYLQTNPPSGTDSVSFYIDDFQLSYVAPPTIQANIPSLFQTLSPYFPLGMAIDPSDLSGPHEQLMTKHFNSMTSGNDMKWSSVENTKGSFNYANADAEVGVAVCNQMLVRGHNLVWATGAQTPSYAFGTGPTDNSPANQATVIANIQEHIQNEVQHFGTKVGLWDVVNEPLDPSQPDCLVHGPFYQVLGKSYIDVALQAARQYAPPGTKLFVNDYSTADPNRLACLVQVVNDLQSRGIPLDGVGHEFHNAINYPSVAAMVNAVNTVANDFPGLDQQVTEYDESVYNAGDNHSDYGNNLPPSVLAEQGWLYFDTFSAFKSLAGKISRVTIWGMADDDTWLDSFPINRTDYPLPFDHGLQAKPAYWGIVDETQLPGYGMAITSSVSAGTSDTRTITLTATNGNVGTAYAMQISGVTLTQLSGPSCTPNMQSPTSFPVILGDMAAGATATTTVTLRINGCNPNAQWQVTVPWVANTYENGTYTFQTDFKHGNGGN